MVLQSQLCKVNHCSGLVAMASQSESLDPTFDLDLVSLQAMPRYAMSHLGFSLFSDLPFLSKGLCSQCSGLVTSPQLAPSELVAIPFPL